MNTYATIFLVVLALATPAKAQWSETWKLLASDGANQDYFGATVALHGDTAIVGAPYKIGFGYLSGAAYIFDARWGTERTDLIPLDGDSEDGFGWGVTLDETTVIVGSPTHSHDGVRTGAAYLFDVTTGQQIRELLAEDGKSGDAFGAAVAIAGGYAVIGASHDDANGTSSGSAYVFDVDTGQQLAKLLPEDGSSYHEFGGAIAIEGNIVIIGAHEASGNNFTSGAAYLFDLATGQQLAKFFADDGETWDRFGKTVDLDSGIAIIGADGVNENGQSSGAAYLFDITTGQQLTKLLPENSAERQYFGSSVAIVGKSVFIGARGDENNSGSVYLFERDTGRQVTKLLPSDDNPGKGFGGAIAVAQDTILIGASGDNDNGYFAGAAYLFPARCPADWDHNGKADTRDLIAYIKDWVAGEDSADLDNDGDVDTIDFTIFLNTWMLGC